MQTYQAPETNPAADGWATGVPARADKGVGLLPHLRALWPAAALLVMGLGGLLVATLMPTGAGGQYAVVAPPWYTLSRTVALVRQAQGDIADAGGPANVVIAHGRGPGFERALYRAGAWLVIDPMQLRGCAGFAPAGGGMH